MGQYLQILERAFLHNSIEDQKQLMELTQNPELLQDICEFIVTNTHPFIPARWRSEYPAITTKTFEEFDSFIDKHLKFLEFTDEQAIAIATQCVNKTLDLSFRENYVLEAALFALVLNRSKSLDFLIHEFVKYAINSTNIEHRFFSTLLKEKIFFDKLKALIDKDQTLINPITLAIVSNKIDVEYDELCAILDLIYITPSPNKVIAILCNAVADKIQLEIEETLMEQNPSKKDARTKSFPIYGYQFMAWLLDKSQTNVDSMPIVNAMFERFVNHVTTANKTGLQIQYPSLSVLEKILYHPELSKQCSAEFLCAAKTLATRDIRWEPMTFLIAQRSLELLKQMNIEPQEIDQNLDRLAEKLANLHRQIFKCQPNREVNYPKNMHEIMLAINQQYLIAQICQHGTSADNTYKIIALAKGLFGAETLMNQVLYFNSAALDFCDTQFGDGNSVCLSAITSQDIANIDKSTRHAFVFNIPLKQIASYPNTFCKIADFCYGDRVRRTFKYEQLEITLSVFCMRHIVTISFEKNAQVTSADIALFGYQNKNAYSEGIFYDLSQTNMFFASYIFTLLNRMVHSNDIQQKLLATDVQQFLLEKMYRPEELTQILVGIGQTLTCCNEVNAYSYLPLDPNIFELCYKISPDKLIRIPKNMILRCWGQDVAYVQQEFESLIKRAQNLLETKSIEDIQHLIDIEFDTITTASTEQPKAMAAAATPPKAEVRHERRAANEPSIAGSMPASAAAAASHTTFFGNTANKPIDYDNKYLLDFGK